MGWPVKKPVFPFRKFPEATVYLGPEMRSTGEVMGWAPGLGQATLKAWLAANEKLPLQGNAYISLNVRDKKRAAEIAAPFVELGFSLLATRGSAETLRQAGFDCKALFKVKEGKPDIVDAIEAGQVQLIVNTPLGETSRYDERAVGSAALQHQVPMVTTLSGAMALARAIRARREQPVHVLSLQERLEQAGRGHWIRGSESHEKV